MALAASAIVLSVLLAGSVPIFALSRADSADQVAASGPIEHPIRKGDCFERILLGYGVPSAEVRRWCRAAKPKANLDQLPVGQSLRLVFASDGQLQRLTHELDPERRLVVERAQLDQLVAHIEPMPVTIRLMGVRGTVRGDFSRSARQAGIPEPVISQMVDLLSGALDFGEDVHRGDRFRVLYERRTSHDGRLLKPGRIVAVDFRGRSRSAAAYLYESRTAEANYLDDRGRLLDGAMLRYPLEFTRITSTFEDDRLHPILKQRRPHLGIDFAAPLGTPVRAIGSGTVIWSDWKGGLGRHVEIDHGEGLVSAYSHLHTIEATIRPGTRVERGHLIGSVGRSGLTTGPHLHFAIFDHGGYVNPLDLRLAAYLTVVDGAAFRSLRDRLVARLESIPVSPRSALIAPETGPSPLAHARGVGPITLTF